MSLRTVYAHRLTLNAYSNTIPRFCFCFCLFFFFGVVPSPTFPWTISLIGHFTTSLFTLWLVVGLSARIFGSYFILSLPVVC